MRSAGVLTLYLLKPHLDELQHSKLRGINVIPAKADIQKTDRMDAISESGMTYKGIDCLTQCKALRNSFD